MAELDKIAELFSENSNPTMNIDGYTDCIRRDKSPTANKQLRWRRADAVANYFINVKRRDKNRISINAPPDDQYVRPNSSAENRAKNRSVTINLIKGGSPGPFPSPGRDQCIPGTGIPPTQCGAYLRNIWWLPNAYVNNATCACETTPDSPTANCVRKFLQDRLAATPLWVKAMATAQKINDNPALPTYPDYIAFVQAFLTWRI